MELPPTAVFSSGVFALDLFFHPRPHPFRFVQHPPASIALPLSHFLIVEIDKVSIFYLLFCCHLGLLIASLGHDFRFFSPGPLHATSQSPL